jgi:hypothetical protein
MKVRRPESKSKSISAQKAWIIANSFCLRQYGTSYSGDSPCTLTLPSGEFWIVPVVYTSPGYGIVGQVGVIAVDARTGEVVGSAPRSQILSGGKRLAGEKKDELRTAFLQARKA